VHRNALVALRAIRALELRATDDEGGGEGWAVRVAPLDEWLAVSRRQVAAVRERWPSRAEAATLVSWSDRHEALRHPQLRHRQEGIPRAWHDFKKAGVPEDRLQRLAGRCRLGNPAQPQGHGLARAGRGRAPWVWTRPALPP
jgi:hypothetical protein